jgi:hypothetical protein
MAHTTCPYGSQLKPEVNLFILGASVMVELAAQFLEIPIVGNVLDFLNWTMFDMQWIADNGPFDYPEITEQDYVDKPALAVKVLNYANAWMWDKFCECQSPPGG